MTNIKDEIKRFSEVIKEIEPTRVKVHVDLPRFREDMGNITKLALSIQKYGQLQPIVLDNDMQLVAGGRRLAACMYLEKPVKYIFVNEADKALMRELEFEENFQRKEFTPPEFAKAISEYHDMKVEEFGPASRGRNTGWSYENTAQALGLTTPTVHEYYQLHQIVKQHPELEKCTKFKELRSAAKGLERVIKRADALNSLEKDFGQKIDVSKIAVCMDAKMHMSTMETDSIDLLLTDPIYMINVDLNVRGAGGETGKFTSQGFSFDDAENWDLFVTMAKESNRFCKKKEAAAFIFVAIEHFYRIRQLFVQNGWLCSVRPIIWTKTMGSSNNPHLWPVPRYEAILYCRRNDTKFLVDSIPDVLRAEDFPGVPGGDKDHVTEKPLKLLQYLIRSVVQPGCTLYDPFMGSGSSLIAGMREKLKVQGCDILPQCIDVFKEKVILESLNVNK